MLRVVAYLAGGVAAVLAMDFVAATTGFFGNGAAASRAEIVSGALTGTVNRSLKGDSLTGQRPTDNSRKAVAAGDSRMLFRMAPLANVTVITKGAASPASERAREPSRLIHGPNRGVDRAPVGSPAAAPERKLLDGCDPSFSPVAAPSLSHISGRCIAAIQGRSKLAALHQ